MTTGAVVMICGTTNACASRDSGWSLEQSIASPPQCTVPALVRATVPLRTVAADPKKKKHSVDPSG
jgi:hypothetical protein